MGLDLWFREDVARILASTQETREAALGATEVVDQIQIEACRRGFSDMSRVVALAFGLGIPAAVSGKREQGLPHFLEARRPPDEKGGLPDLTAVGKILTQ